MDEPISDEMFVREMQILWQKSGKNNIIGKIIRKYFSEGDRAVRIISKMQERIDE